MTDSNRPATSGNGADGAQFLLQQLFIKDLSFEAPHAPITLQSAKGEPDVKLNLRHSAKALDGDVYEVVLHISVHADLDGKTVFLAELDQAGLFLIRGYEEEQRKQLLGVFCPNTLFPYAREAISSTVAKGGFPPLMLQPINFEALYAQATRKQEGQA